MSEKPPKKPTLSIVKEAKPVNTEGLADKWGDRRISAYLISKGRIQQITTNKQGEQENDLTINFAAIIDEQVTLDDGAKQENAFLISGKHIGGQPLPTLTITASQYLSMQWPLKYWGAKAIISANQATPRQLANAILILSGDIPITTIYQHTGWRLIGGERFYLSHSGAIGANGLDTQTRVDLGEGNIKYYSLPTPPAPENKQRQIAGFCRFLEVAPNNKAVGVAMLCGVVQAILGECLTIDYSMFFAGQSGSQKSEVAAMMMACFGQDFNSRRFPCNFSDSESALESKAFKAKDAVIVVDDYYTGISTQETNRSLLKLDRLGRGAGNKAGRERCNADMSSKPAYYPRGLVVVTGEEFPRGASLNARFLIVEMRRAEVDLVLLSHLQLLASRGDLAAAMAAFAQWLAPRITDLKKSLPLLMKDLRDKARDEKLAQGCNDRAYEILALMNTAASVFIDFAYESGAINNLKAGELSQYIEEVTRQLVRAQSQFQRQTDEVERFKALLRGCFSAGECHVSHHENAGPPDAHPFTWGWRKPGEDISLSLIGQGQPIGYIHQAKNELWLEPEGLFKTIQRFASAQNDPLLIQKATLWKRLLERGLLLEHETDKKSGTKRPDVKKGMKGKRVRVLVFNTNVVTDDE